MYDSWLYTCTVVVILFCNACWIATNSTVLVPVQYVVQHRPIHSGSSSGAQNLVIKNTHENVPSKGESGRRDMRYPHISIPVIFIRCGIDVEDLHLQHCRNNNTTNPHERKHSRSMYCIPYILKYVLASFPSFLSRALLR